MSSTPVKFRQWGKTPGYGSKSLPSQGRYDPPPCKSSGRQSPQLWPAKEKQLLIFLTLDVWRVLLCGDREKYDSGHDPRRGGETHVVQATATPEGRDSLLSDVWMCAEVSQDMLSVKPRECSLSSPERRVCWLKVQAAYSNWYVWFLSGMPPAGYIKQDLKSKKVGRVGSMDCSDKHKTFTQGFQSFVEQKSKWRVILSFEKWFFLCRNWIKLRPFCNITNVCQAHVTSFLSRDIRNIVIVTQTTILSWPYPSNFNT